MSETRHTPEPWLVEACGTRISHFFAAGDGSYLIPVADLLGEARESNAKRIVACVNACEGIDDPANLRRQRDELLAALHGLHGWLAKSVIEKQPAIDDLCAIDATVAKSTTPTTEMK